MGVLTCGRKGCDEIMCQTYVDDIGYICDECQSEFNATIGNDDDNVFSQGEIVRELTKFMVIRKDIYLKDEKMSVVDFFDKYRN